MKSNSSRRSGLALLAASSDLRSRELPQSSRESNVCPKRQSSLTAFIGRAYARRVPSSGPRLARHRASARQTHRWHALGLVREARTYRATRDEVRASMGNRFVEVHLKASLEERVRRDRRGLYAKALGGELPGSTSVSDPFEEPLAPELVLETERETPEESAERVLALLDRRIASDLAA
jgi:hypothetical protein